MPDITLSDRATQILTSALNGLAARQQVIGNNLANVDTPGFKASDVRFADQLQKAMQPGDELQIVSTHAQHIPTPGDSSGPQIVPRHNTSQRLDGNNVDVEREMAYLAETVIHFQATTRMVARRLALLRTVINEGRR